MMLLIIFFIIFSLTLFYTNYLLTLHQTKYETIHLSNYTKYKEEIINFYKIKKHTNILVKLHINLDKTYNYDLLNHGLTIAKDNNEVTFQVDNSGAINTLTIHNLEFPFEFRWRDSDAQTYKFWRVYMGVKASYNVSNNFKFTDQSNSFSYKNVSRFNSWQYGLTFSVGYDVFTAHMYYGLTPMLKDTMLGTTDISSKTIRIGLIFYLL